MGKRVRIRRGVRRIGRARLLEAATLLRLLLQLQVGALELRTMLRNHRLPPLALGLLRLRPLLPLQALLLLLTK